MQIYLVRHPPPIDVDGLCYGQLDVTVTAQSVAATAESVLVQIPSRVLAEAPIYCSPSSRCLGLARHLASPREPILAEDLVEMNFGHWQGLPWNAVPREQIDAWAKDVWGYRPGGGESSDMVQARWQRWLNHLRRISSRAVVAVTHAGVIRIALAGGRRSHDSSAIEARIPFGSVHPLDLG